MSDVFISYARSTAKQAQAVVEALRGLGYSVWIDDDLPAHRTFSGVIEEQMTAAKAAVVIWSADAVRSEWVLSEANRAREERKLVQVITDKTRLPMPFDTIQCADLMGWTGDMDAPGWRKVVSSIAELAGASSIASAPTSSAAPPPLPSKPSIAVMPFANLSSDPEQDYFADGMVEEVTTALSRFKSIFVVGASSGLSFKGKEVSPQEAARALGVRYILEGSVRKAANRVRIAVKLMDAADGSQIWAERFEDTLEDVFALQDRVALSVAGRIEPTLRDVETRRASGRPTESMNSYDLYLRAFSLIRTYVEADMVRALSLAERAIRFDPDYGAALGVAAECRLYLHLYGWADDRDGNLRQGIEVARRALKAAGDDAQVLAIAAGVVAYLERDPDAAIPLIDRATSLNPGSAFAWYISGSVRLFAGETDVGVEHLEMSMRLDPLGQHRTLRTILMGWGRMLQGRFGEAVAVLREVVQETDSPGGHAILAASYGNLGQVSLAQELLRRYGALTLLPVEDFARSVSLDPRDVETFLDGIALAEGKNPTDAAIGAEQP